MKSLLCAALVIGMIIAPCYSFSFSDGPVPSVDPLALVFPVAGKKAAVGSFWGAPRDGGKRKHEGIDVFAKKGTPVVAISNGPKCNKVEYSAISQAETTRLDNEEADGETSTFEITDTQVIYKTIYKEDKAGEKKTEDQKLGELNRDTPTEVRDFYDDPRLGHT